MEPWNAWFDPSEIDIAGDSDFITVHFWHGGNDELEIKGEVHLLFDFGRVEDGEVVAGTVRIIARGHKVKFSSLKKHNQEKIKALVVDEAIKKYEKIEGERWCR